MKSPRRRAREFALQGLYQWHLSGNDLPAIEAHLAAAAGFEKVDRALFDLLLRGAIAEAAELQALIEPQLDRPYAELSPVERAILYIGTFELSAHPKTPFKVVLNEAVELGKSFGASEGYRFVKVVINEAIELAKSYGGTDGHKYVNGVLDKLAVLMRPEEAARPGRARSSNIPEEK